MSSFEIPDGPANVTLRAGSKPADAATGSAVYAVTNKTAAPVTARITLQVAGDAKNDWFTVEGERERPFGPGETQTVTVSIKLPAGTPAGEHKFRLRVVAVNDPDNDHMESPIGTVVVDATGHETHTRFPWWIVAVGVAVLALVVFLVTAFVTPGFLRSKPTPTPTSTPTPTPTPTPTFPAFSQEEMRHKPYVFAEGYLSGLGYKPRVQANATATGLAPDEFMSATVSTAAGDPLGTVIVTYDPGVRVPMFKDTTISEAQQRAVDKVQVRLCRPRVVPMPTSGRITDQSLGFNDRVAKNALISLTVQLADGVDVCRRFTLQDVVSSAVVDYKAQGFLQAQQKMRTHP